MTGECTRVCFGFDIPIICCSRQNQIHCFLFIWRCEQFLTNNKPQTALKTGHPTHRGNLVNISKHSQQQFTIPLPLLLIRTRKKGFYTYITPNNQRGYAITHHLGCPHALSVIPIGRHQLETQQQINICHLPTTNHN